MSKTDDTSKLDHAKLENRVLADSELDAVTGGKLLETAVKGKVYHRVEIHGTHSVGQCARTSDGMGLIAELNGEKYEQDR